MTKKISFAAVVIGALRVNCSQWMQLNMNIHEGMGLTRCPPDSFFFFFNLNLYFQVS